MCNNVDLTWTKADALIKMSYVPQYYLTEWHRLQLASENEAPNIILDNALLYLPR